MLYKGVNKHGGDIYSRPVELDFSASVNPLGTPVAVIDAMKNAAEEVANYPDPYCRELKKAISTFEDLPEDYILAGNGAAELIYGFCQAKKGKFAIEVAPTFSEYSDAFQKAGGMVLRYAADMEKDFEVGQGFLDFVRETGADTIFVCNPNNPTGRLVEEGILLGLLEYCHEKGATLFLDECFIDLACGKSMKSYLADYPELFILKAFTKNYAMAGARLGYCLTSDERLLARMAAQVQPWNVSVMAQAGGIAALNCSLEEALKVIETERAYLTEALKNMNYEVCPSHANYILFRGPEDLGARLLEKGIAIRDCSNFSGLRPGWYRIAIRKHEENKVLMDEIERK